MWAKIDRILINLLWHLISVSTFSFFLPQFLKNPLWESPWVLLQQFFANILNFWMCRLRPLDLLALLKVVVSGCVRYVLPRKSLDLETEVGNSGVLAFTENMICNWRSIQVMQLSEVRIRFTTSSDLPANCWKIIMENYIKCSHSYEKILKQRINFTKLSLEMTLVCQ